MVLSAFCKSSFSLFAFYKKIYIKTMNDKKKLLSLSNVMVKIYKYYIEKINSPILI